MQTANFLTAQNIESDRQWKKIDMNLLLKLGLSGKITDIKTGELLPGASVYFADDKIGTIADAKW